MSYLTGHIGCGNMGGAIAEAVAKTAGGKQMLLSDLNAEKVCALSQKYGCESGDTDQVISGCKYVFLGVKPQNMKEVAESLRPALAKRKTPVILVSMAAGLSLSTISQWIGLPVPMIRIMPNLPVTVGKGVILVSYSKDITPEAREEFSHLLSRAGVLIPIEETKIDAASALSGCGPAFVAMAIEALADGGVEAGLPRSLSLECAAETMIGTAMLFLQSGISTSELKDRVCSPGGSTIVGVHALESRGFRDALISAVTESYEKTLALGKK